MKKERFLAATMLMACMAATPAFAQDAPSISEETVEYSTDKYKVETNHFWDNWFVSAAGGAQIFFGDHDRFASFGDRLAPNLDIAVGKWFTPGIGVRLMYSGLQIKGATKLEGNMGGYDVAHGTGKPLDGEKGQRGGGYELQHQKFRMANYHADVLFNLSNLLFGYRETRLYNLSAYAGVGYARCFDAPGAKEVSMNIGFLNTFRLCDALLLNVDVRGMMVQDRFDGEVGYGQKRNSDAEGLLSASIGLTYRFKQRGWNRSRTIVRYDNDALNEMRARLDASTRENQRLREALANKDKQTAQTIVRKIAAANLVTFKINKSDLSNEARANLGMLAEVIKQGDSNAVYTITGYADKGTGTEEINQRLSQERAQAVYDCLTGEFGVNPQQLRVDAQGGVDDMFYNDPRLSRAVITRGE